MTKLDGDPSGRGLRRSNRKQAQASNTAVSGAEQHSGERRWNPFRTKHLLDSVCEVVTSFSSEQWDAMLKAGWRFKDAQILDGALVAFCSASWLGGIHLQKPSNTGKHADAARPRIRA